MMRQMIIIARVYIKVQAKIPIVKSMLILFSDKLKNFAIQWVECRETASCR